MRLKTIHRESLGLRIMLASLMAIAVVLALTFRFQLTQTTEQVRAKGINLARLVTKLPVTEQQLAGWQQVLAYQLSDPSFAYGAVVSQDGTTLVEVTASGVIVPEAASLLESAWLQETERSLGQARAIEFYGPLQVGRSAGHFRIGLFKPSFGITLDQLPFIASLMLPVFLLAPLFLFFVKREVNPLKQVNADLANMLKSSETTQNTPRPPTDVRSFIEQFNTFIDHARVQIDSYQDEKSKLLTSEKFLSYRMGRFESILNSVPDGVLVVDGDGSVIFANGRLKALLDVDPQAMQGAKLSTCLQHPELVTYFTKHEHNIGALVGETLLIKPPSRPEISVGVTVHRLREAESPAAHSHVVLFRDASVEARAQQSRSEFVAHLAHELKAPLHTVSMYSEALQGDAGKAEEFQLEAANVISDEVERLTRLINNLLSMTQIEMGTLQLNRQRIKLTDLVRDTAETMERSARGRELKFELDLPGDVVPVHVDKDLMRIAIGNLLTNAIKYTDAGGTISVSLSESADAVTICVADTGIGIQQAEQAQIFHKFYRVAGEDSENRSGHGLGLPLARDIVEMHHGSIRVESEPGEGSHFYIDLWKQAGVMKLAI